MDENKATHCIARMLLDAESGTNVKCLYCKYATECAEEFKNNRSVYFLNVMTEIRQKTGVCLPSLKDLHSYQDKEKFLKGSWIEDDTELLKEFTKISFDEQLDKLQGPDILNHVDSR